MEHFSKGIIPDIVVFNSEERFQIFQYLLHSEKIEKVILPTLLYDLLEKRDRERLFVLLKEYEWTVNRKVLKTWLEKLPSMWADTRGYFIPYREVSASNKKVLNECPMTVREYMEALSRRAHEMELIGEAFYEMAETSLTMDYPILSFTRHFKRMLKLLEIPSFEVISPCVNYLKRLHQTKKRYFNRVREYKIIIGRKRVPVGKLFLLSIRAMKTAVMSQLEQPMRWVASESVYALIQNGL